MGRTDYKWRANTLCYIEVTFSQACRLGRIGEHVSPNPFYNKEKWDAIRAAQEKDPNLKHDLMQKGLV